MTSHSCDILRNDPITVTHDTKLVSSSRQRRDSHAYETRNTGDTRRGSSVLAAQLLGVIYNDFFPSFMLNQGNLGFLLRTDFC